MTRPFGYCIFTFEGGDWQTDNFPGLERGFELASQLGFAYVEIPSYVKVGRLIGDEPRTDLQLLNRLGTVAQLSKRYGVPLSAIFAAADLWDPEGREGEYNHLSVLARIASTFGITQLPVTIGMHRGSDNRRWSAEVGRLVTEAGKRTQEFGVRLTAHPHIETPIETRDEIDAFFESAESDYVGFCLDTGHVLAGGGDPVDVAQAYGSIISYVHAKDVDREASLRGLTSNDSRARYMAFRNPGAGDVDFPGVFNALAMAGFDGPILAENDLSPNPEAAMRESAAYLGKVLEGA
jgi:sugar phosphate isomerase/epimerase